MAFDPDAFLAQGSLNAPSGNALSGPFDPDEFLEAQKEKDEAALQARAGTPGQQALSLVEGAAKGLAGPIATGAERVLSEAGVPGLTPLEQEERAAANPITHGVGEAGGLLVPALFTAGTSAAGRAALEAPEAASLLSKAAGFTQGELLSQVGKAAATALGLAPEGAGVINRIGSHVVSGAIENALFSAGDIGSKIINGQSPEEAIETALPYVGLSALAGGVLGAGFGSAPELWKALHGADTGGILRAVTNRLGGKEGVIDDPITRALETVDIQPKPEIVSAMASDPAIQNMAKILEQSDITGSGVAYQSALKSFHQDTQSAIANAFGKTPEQLENIPELSKYEAGKSIGKIASDEIQDRIDPSIKEFEDLKSKYKNAPFAPEGTLRGQYDLAALSAAPDTKIPGTATLLANKLCELSDREGWTGSDTEINKELNRVLKQLPEKKTLGQLTELITQVGNNTKTALPSPLMRAGQLIKNVLREEEDHLALTHLGEQGPELVDRFQKARAAFKIEAQLKDALDERLHIGGSVSGFAKNLKTMANEEGEKLLQRLSGKNDAHLLQVLSESLPKTAQALKDYHVNSILESALKKTKTDQVLNINAIKKSIDALSPELREFAIPKGITDKLDAVQILQDRLNRVPHNFSNTARVNAALNKYGLSSSLGMVSALTGHSTLASAVTSGVMHTIQKAPDAARLALLKFLGSKEPINGAGFKATVDFINSAMKGERTAVEAAKNIFKAGSKVIPEHLIPTEKSRKKLEESLNRIKNNESSEQVKDLNHYLPNHSIAADATVYKAAQLLNSLKPQEIQKSPLDETMPVNSAKQKQYERALDIAEQPLMALQYAKDGTLQAQDVNIIKSLYPSLYNKLSEELYVNVAKEKQEGKLIPYSKKMSLSMFVGRPLDSTLTQSSMQNVITSNGAHAQAQSQTMGKNKKVSQSTASSMEKVDSLYQTPSQARQANKG